MMRSHFQSCSFLIGILGAFAFVHGPSAQTAMHTDWKSGQGQWRDASKWSAGLPDAFKRVAVEGHSTVVVPRGDYLAGLLEVGTHKGDRARVEVDGGQLVIRQDSLIIGEETGGEGDFVLNSGTVQSAMDVFVGGATASTGRMNRSSLVIKGGSFLGLTLTVGEGLGSRSSVEIVGSKARSIVALEFVAFDATADPSGTPGQTTLTFTLDRGGVTPISIRSRWTGLRIEHDRQSHCSLQIALSAAPPPGDVTLIASRVATQGFFDNLPEGSEISAQYAGQTYRWTLTYRGGASGHDLVLLDRSASDGHPHLDQEAKIADTVQPLWWGHPLYPLAIPTGRPAFPGAEGYGAYSRGGSGGRKIYVDNLNDAGPGSLRAAVEAEGPRIAVFRVGGVIRLQSRLIIAHPFLTIDGSGAPLPGILLRRHGIEVHTHDVVLRQFRIRIGDEDVRSNDKNIRYAAGDGEYALYFTDGSRNCIADHLSLSWSTNKILSTTKMSDRITIQWSILSEALNLDGHGYASITGGNRVSWHHNLFAHNFGRNVRFQGVVDADFRNNVVYDWGETAGYGEFDRLNYVGNYLKPGPSTIQAPRLFMRGTETVAPGSLFLSGNVMEGNARATSDNWKGTGFYFDRATIEAAGPFPAPPVQTESADAAYQDVLLHAGATLPRRDAVDERIVHEVRTGTGRIVDSVDEAGGWPNF